MMSHSTRDFPDHILSAYLDSELPALQMTAVRAALARDPSLRDRLATLALADKLVRQHARALDEQDMPAAVLALLDGGNNSSAAQTGTAQILSGPWQRWRQYSGRHLALAASVAVVVSLATLYLNRPAPLVQGAGLPALALYEDSLENTPSGTPVNIGAATLLTRFSFRDPDERYCRQYQLVAPGFNTENLACRQDGRWELQATVRLPLLATGEYQPASTAATELDALLDTLMGTALDPVTEAALIGRGWQEQ